MQEAVRAARCNPNPNQTNPAATQAQTAIVGFRQKLIDRPQGQDNSTTVSPSIARLHLLDGSDTGDPQLPPTLGS